MMMSAHRILAVAVLTVVIFSGCRSQTGIRVLRAVDGDTLKVRMEDGKVETVRIIGVNSPETVDPRKKVQCYGPEASARMHALADGKMIQLETRPGDDRDDYGRLLRYVRMEGNDLGAQMISEGYARAYDFFPHPRRQNYDQLAASAKAEGRGLWSACSHRGNSH